MNVQTGRAKVRSQSKNLPLHAKHGAPGHFTRRRILHAKDLVVIHPFPWAKLPESVGNGKKRGPQGVLRIGHIMRVAENVSAVNR